MTTEVAPPIEPTETVRGRAGGSAGQRGLTKSRRSAVFAGAALVVVVGTALGYVLTLSSGTSIAGDSPKQIGALMTAAVNKAGSVHIVTSLQAAQGKTATYVNDARSSSGREAVTFGGAKMTVLVVGGTGYLNANQSALTSLLQVQPSIARTFAGKWLSFSSDGQAYKALTQTLVLSSLLQQVTPTGAVSKLSHTTVNGRSVLGLHGALPGGLTGTLYVSTSGSPLPVEVVTTGGGSSTAVFGDWGESVNVTPPTGAIPGSEAGLS